MINNIINFVYKYSKLRIKTLKSAIDGIDYITNTERLVYVLWFAHSVRSPLSVHQPCYLHAEPYNT